MEEKLEEAVTARENVPPIHILVDEDQASELAHWQRMYEDLHWPFGIPARLADFIDRPNRHLHPFYAELFNTQLIAEEEDERSNLRNDALHAFTDRVVTAMRRLNMTRHDNSEENLRRRARAWIDHSATRGMMAQEWYFALQRLRWMEYVELERSEKNYIQVLKSEYDEIDRRKIQQEDDYIVSLMRLYWKYFSIQTQKTLMNKAF
jgi:hypothetical protein